MNPQAGEVAGVILAAGEGRRIGRSKALLEIDGVKFLERVVLAIRAAGCEPVVVVGGADADAVRAEAQRLDARFALNSDWERGQFSSLKVGLAGSGSEPQGVMVALVDHPFVAEETYRLLFEAFKAAPQKIFIPSHRGTRGHPVVVPRKIVDEIVRSSDDLTLRDVMKKHADLIVELEVKDPGILKDVDTAVDLER
ncbi:MAG: nucleotidyltransferase family protein [Candidatus Eiseniibacteriota bacterium]|nr:MAG: nucleotidyltransferase family protein [Candidatus Eisenbacteria bacterium]